MLATPPSINPRTFAGEVFHPGERGTPTPASAVYSTSQRTVFLPTGPRTALTEPAVSGFPRAPATTAVAPAQPPARVRAAPVLAAPAQAVGATQTPAGPVVPAPTVDSARDSSPARRVAPALPPGSFTATREGPVRYGTSAAPAAAFSVPLASTPSSTRGSLAGQSSATGIALPPPGIVVPATGIALPPPSITVPATGIALPPASAIVPSGRPAAMPAQTQQPVIVIVPPAPSAIALPADHAVARGNGDADGARGARAGAAPVAPPAPALR